MNSIAETQQRIKNSDDFVFAEIQAIQYFYNLKGVIRYDGDRSESIATESVAEHVCVLHFLADYFLPLEDPEGKLDTEKVRFMIEYHDIDEIETGDTIEYLKSNPDEAVETDAVALVTTKLPEHMRQGVSEVLSEYSLLKSREAKFVRALDKLEPVFHLFSENGKKILHHHETTATQCHRSKKPAISIWPYMNRFYVLATERMEQEGYFAKEETPLS